MAFIQQTSFLPRHSHYLSSTTCARHRPGQILATAADERVSPPTATSDDDVSPTTASDGIVTPVMVGGKEVTVASFAGSKVDSADAMEFFRHREGKWDSWRVTHHLAFKRSEAGESAITMKVLDPSDERIVSLCKDWDVDPKTAHGGCYVTWEATMAWDQEGENHEGSTVFALVPDEGDLRTGRMLRDRGYAEIVPICGRYSMDEGDDLLLVTPYDGGEVNERFSFDGMDVVNRVSTVRRFGGFSTATFATERRLGVKSNQPLEEKEGEKSMLQLVQELSLHGPGIVRKTTDEEENKVVSGGFGRSRWGTENSKGPPSANSAFGSGFGAVSKKGTKEEQKDGLRDDVLEAAKKAGVDLSKVPPSMRDAFLASFRKEKKN